MASLNFLLVPNTSSQQRYFKIEIVKKQKSLISPPNNNVHFTETKFAQQQKKVVDCILGNLIVRLLLLAKVFDGIYLTDTRLIGTVSNSS